MAILIKNNKINKSNNDKVDKIINKLAKSKNMKKFIKTNI